MTDSEAPPTGTLYLVGTPIGNLEDVTLRALRILREVPVIAAEDTRQTRRLLEHFGIQKPLLSYHEHVEQTRLNAVLERLRVGDVALVSDAGMPGISDPGYDLVRAAIAAGIPVVPIPGASAPIAALAASGLPTDRFLYLGFLPRRSSDRRRALADIRSEPSTLIAFEAPHRVVATLEDVENELGDRPVVVARELTKLHEEFRRGTARSVRESFLAQPARGELTLVIGGAPENEPKDRDDEILARLDRHLTQGVSARDAVDAVAAETAVPRRQVYRLLLARRNCGNI